MLENIPVETNHEQQVYSPITFYLLPIYLFSEKLKPRQRDFSLFTFHSSLFTKNI